MSKTTTFLFLMASVLFGQATAPKPAPPKNAPKPAATKAPVKKVPPKKAPVAGPAKVEAPPAPAAEPVKEVKAVTPKGFSRVDVTPTYKREFETEMRAAVLVAPSYRDSGLQSLRYTLSDVVELKAELARQGYSVFVIAGTDASADYVRQRVQEMKQLLEGKSQTTLLFAFSGHGFQTPAGKNYLMTYGVTPDKVESQALALDDVQELMSATGARRKVILVDACRNDPEAKSAGAPRSFVEFKEAEGFSILLSTMPGGFSYEDSNVKHGIFTYHVLEGLRGKAAGKDGYVTFFDLQKYVERAVTQHAIKLERVQKPFAMGERSGDFLLATAAPPKPEEVKPTGVGEVDTNSQVLLVEGENRQLYAMLVNRKLVLINARTYVPEMSVEEYDGAKTPEGYKRFRGMLPGAANEILDLAVEVKGENIVAAKGRIGRACPGDRECIKPDQVPLLPGEERSKLRDISDKVGRTTGKLTGIFRKNDKRKEGEKAKEVNIGAEGTKALLDSANNLLKYQWRKFDLLGDLTRQAAR